MKTKPSLSREQLLLGATLLLLGLLALFVWLNDPNHPPPGKSRVDWPEPEAIKP